MKNEDKDPYVFLRHIHDEAEFIIETISPMSRDEFFKSRLVQGSMRNSIMIIGEGGTL